MAQDPREEKVTARVIFVGVMLGCINTDENNNKRYEVGMIRCPEHAPQIWIAENGKEKEFIWPGHDLIFKVANPKESGVRLHLPDPDPSQTSFSLVLDVEGPDLHAGGITVNTALFDGRRIGLTAGLLYAHQLTEDLILKTWTHDTDLGTFVKPFGRIANHVGLNIVCHEDEDNGIAIVDAVTGTTLHWMPALPGAKYEIEVNNDCNRTLAPRMRPAVRAMAEDADADALSAALANGPIGSDFRFNYQVMRPTDTEDKRKFDFEQRLVPGLPPLPSPDVCNLSGGGKTTSIGFDWSKS